MSKLDGTQVRELLVQIAQLSDQIAATEAFNDLCTIAAKSGFTKLVMRKELDAIRKNMAIEAAEKKKAVGQSHLSLVGASVKPVTAPYTDPLEIEAVNIFAQQCGDQYRFNVDTGTWFEWTGNRWQNDSLLRAERKVITIVDAMRALDPENRRPLGKIAFAMNALRGSQSHPNFTVQQDSFDSDPLLLGTPDGYVDLKTGQAHKPDPAKMISRNTTVSPADDVDAPIWLDFIDFATSGDKTVAGYLQKFLGYCLSGLVNEEIMTFIYGPGGNGKGVMLGAVGRILGDYYLSTPSSTFMDTKHQEHATELARLNGPRLVSASETNENDKWNLSRIKEITGNENPISARFMRQDFFTFWPKFKLLIIGNSKPSFGEVDPAITRRLRLVEMTATPKAADTTLKDRLKPEYPSILRWLLDGFETYLEEGLDPPDAVRKASSAYLASEDVTRNFIETWLTIDHEKPEWVVTRAEITEAVSAYSQLNGAGRSLSARKVYKRLIETHLLNGEYFHKKQRSFKCVTFQQDAYEVLQSWRLKQMMKAQNQTPGDGA